MAAEIKSVPLMEQPPKRGPGRPPKLDPITGERVNPPGGRKRGGSSTPRKPRSLEPQIGALLMSVNIVVMMVPPLREDALDATEVTALAKAIDSQCQTSPRFRKYVERMLTAGSGGQLLGVVAIIGARRAARHGLAPAELDPMLGMMLAGNVDGIGNMAPPDAPREDAPETGEVAPRPIEVGTFDFEGTLSD